MMIDDQYIINNFFRSDKHINSRKIENISSEELEYLNNRYSDSLSIKETLQRILFNINTHPKCPTCGKLLPFVGKPNSKIGMFLKHCNISCANSDPNVYNKQNKTKLERYGSKNNYDKIKETVHKKYHISNIFNLDSIRNKNIISVKSQLANQKRKNTCLIKYGVDHPWKSKEIRNKINYELLKSHEIETKRKNHTFNTSILETKSYKLLKEKYPNIKYQYKSDVYPFICDFYIPELDLYIECNYHWTHGGKPYEGTSEDNIIVEKWKAKNTLYYNNAIYTWTIRDIKKRNIAKENNLNYIEFWNIQDLYNWIS